VLLTGNPTEDNRKMASGATRKRGVTVSGAKGASREVRRPGPV
jgi:hypothetical protein